jgi:hypothetical protein
MAKKWIQKSVKKPGRVKKYIREKFGDKAFTARGTIKPEYLNKAEKLAENNPSLKAAIILAKRLKKMK